MNQYELILIFDPKMGEDKIDHFVTKVGEKIKGWGGEVEGVEKWGAKRLASIMSKAKTLQQGFYVLVRFKSPANVPGEVKAFLKVSESVVRSFLSRAVAAETVTSEKSEIAGKPLDAVSVGEIKGEPLGKPE
ncbi:MAG: 30S ribosomal protein S6 [Candidatus Margulisbacteria bacterium]|nr:30S ribosomal protein S6 [Candidatus Margulisiibacteriota bacterium]